MHPSHDDEPTTPETELLPRVHRCDRRRMNPCRSQAPVRRIKLRSCCLANSGTIGAASRVGHPSFTVALPSGYPAPYVFLKATRASVMARPTCQRSVSFPHHRDRSHRTRDSWLDPRTKDFIIGQSQGFSACSASRSDALFVAF